MKKALLSILIITAIFPIFFGFFTPVHAQTNPMDSDASYMLGAKDISGYVPPAPTASTFQATCFDESQSGLGYLTSFSITGCMASASNLLLWVTARFLWVAGVFFDKTLDIGLNFAALLTHIPVVDVGWKIFRDIANICFIFILLAIAIGTILRIDSYNVKKLLVQVIITALILNFSLFFTKVVIDASNILALQFYNKISLQGGGQGASADPFGGVSDGGISQAFLKGLSLTSIYNSGATLQGSPDPTQTPGGLNLGENIIAIGLGGSILILIAAFAFIAGGIMFIVRTVVLMFVMILSPLAFLARTLPQTKGQFSKWVGTLMTQSFFAPLYLIMIYIVVAILNSMAPAVGATPTQGTSFADLLVTNGSAVGTLYTFVILIGLMFGSLIIAKQLGAAGSGFARNVAGKATFGAGAWMARQTLGRGFNKLSESGTLNRMRNANLKISDPRTYGAGLARVGAGIVDNRAKGTWDLRNTSAGKGASGAVGGLGTVDGTGGAKKYVQEEKARENNLKFEEKKKKLKNSISKGTPADIQSSLKEFSSGEFAKLGGEFLNNRMIIENATPDQVKSVMDSKDIDDVTKARVAENRVAVIKEAVATGNATTIKNAMENSNLSVKEKASLPDDLANNPLVYKNFSQEIRDEIGKRGDLTQTQKTAMKEKRKEHLLDKLNGRGVAGVDAKDIIKNMSGRDIYEAMSSPAAPVPITDDSIVEHLSEAQLKDLEKTGISAAEKHDIGEKIRNWGIVHGRKHPTGALKYVRVGGPLKDVVGTPIPNAGSEDVGEGYDKWS